MSARVRSVAGRIGTRLARLETTMSEQPQSAEEMMTPEELILNMSTDELQELLDDMGLTASQEMAQCIQSLVRETESLEAAIEALAEASPVRRAA